MWARQSRGDMAGTSDAKDDEFWCDFCACNNVTLITWHIQLFRVNRSVNGPLISIILRELVVLFFFF